MINYIVWKLFESQNSTIVLDNLDVDDLLLDLRTTLLVRKPYILEINLEKILHLDHQVSQKISTLLLEYNTISAQNKIKAVVIKQNMEKKDDYNLSQYLSFVQTKII